MTPLLEEQADHAREIAEQEVRRFARLLAAEIEATPMRADGAMNAGDLYHCLNATLKRYDDGDIV